jgi:hypothetical protein
MATATAASPTSALRHVTLLAGLLGIIAGLLGMHVLAGLHGTHSQAAHAGPAHTSAATAATPHFMPADHAHAGHSPATEAAAAGPVAAPPVTAASVTVDGTPMPASCTCQGGCAEKPALHLDCTPSGSSATLSPPPPCTTVVQTQPWAAAIADKQMPSAHIPGSPTPNDLSISRT